MVDRSVLSIEALLARVNAAVPEETLERALVFAARELQQVVWWYVVVLVDNLDDARERVAELRVVRQGEAFAQQGRGEWRCGHRMRMVRGRGWC